MNQETGLVSMNISFSQSLEIIVPAIEFRHIYIGVAYFIGAVGIAASTARDTVLISKGLRFG